VIVGVDLRDRSVHTVLADEEGRVMKRDRRPVTIHALTESLRAVDAQRATAFGIATRHPLASSTQDTLADAVTAIGGARPPRIVRHGAAVALAEQWSGAARGMKHVVALNVDDVVDAGIVVDGRLFAGAHGDAGIAAWLALHPVEREDYRRMGCLEAEIGAPGIVRRLIWRIKAGDESRVLEMAGGDFTAITIEHIFAGARAGDGVSLSIVRDTVRFLGMGVSNLVATVDPEVAVLSGIVADAADLLLESCRTELARRLPSSAAARLQVLAGTLGRDAAALGAARAAMLAA
jgi:predicted NBD/HSP70 family sugar kinase